MQRLHRFPRANQVTALAEGIGFIGEGSARRNTFLTEVSAARSQLSLREETLLEDNASKSGCVAQGCFGQEENPGLSQQKSGNHGDKMRESLPSSSPAASQHICWITAKIRPAEGSELRGAAVLFGERTSINLLPLASSDRRRTKPAVQQDATLASHLYDL